MKVFVGSKNNVKIEAVREAFYKVFAGQELDVQGFSVESGVSDQPLSEEETMTGARNRVAALKKQGQADYYVGLEGGLIHIADNWMECGWIVIHNNQNIEGIGATVKIMIPDHVYEYLETGKNTLNDVCEQHFGVVDAGSKTGYYGLMTNEAINRTQANVDAVACALARFAHPEVFEA